MQLQVIYEYNQILYCCVAWHEDCSRNIYLNVSNSLYIDRLCHTCIFSHPKVLLELPLFSGFAMKRSQCWLTEVKAWRSPATQYQQVRRKVTGHQWSCRDNGCEKNWREVGYRPRHQYMPWHFYFTHFWKGITCCSGPEAQRKWHLDIHAKVLTVQWATYT